MCVCGRQARPRVPSRARVKQKSSFEKHAGDGGFGRSDIHPHVLVTIGQNAETQKKTKKKNQHDEEEHGARVHSSDAPFCPRRARTNDIAREY